MANKFNAPRWDIEAIFPGGSASKEFADFRLGLKKDLDATQKSLENLTGKIDPSSYAGWGQFILDMQKIYMKVYQASSFAGCLVSQDVNDADGHKIDAEIDVYNAQWSSMMTGFEEFSIKVSDDQWDEFIIAAKLADIRFFLDKMRERAKSKMAPEFERLVLDLAIDGYHGWNRLYDKMAGDLRADFVVDGETQSISMGQLAPKMDDPNREVRRLAFEKLEESWESRAELSALTLNSQAGFRLALYKNRNWDSILYEPLQAAKLKEESLEAMWSAISKATPGFQKYVDARKKLLGIDKYMWYDQTASVGKLDKTYSFPEAEDFIVEHIGSFSKEMGEFSRMALDKRWVEGEDRSGKAAGGFCTGFPIKQETRIFMTYTGTFGGLSTLAHELGHSYHSYVLKDLPIFASRYPMTLAETASTFNELRVKDAALELAADPGEKLMMLDQKLQDGYIMMCNLHARFIFDKAFYTERKTGIVSRKRLDELMLESQKKAYAGTLDDNGYHKLFWASKLHFYLTGQPFYNFPYTFGFLFAVGIYDRALKEGSAFAKAYKELLADTGGMMAEEVAQKHLGVDLTKEDYWADAVARVMSDIDPFVELAGKSDD
ncbi:MAG: M3 family oligoendopeptidase [candidate division Zixibacteria bacterium]|nr:M3 family oligoendopeptidase [candidate division Zixibacteria bacterium]